MNRQIRYSRQGAAPNVFSKKEAIFTKRSSYFSNGNKNGVAPILQGRQFNFSGEFWFALITNINNNIGHSLWNIITNIDPKSCFFFSTR